MKNNMIPKIKINYSGKDRKRSEIDENLAKKERQDIIDGKVPLSKLLDSKRKVILAEADESFLHDLRTKLYPGEKGKGYVEMITSMANAYRSEYEDLTDEEESKLESDAAKFTATNKVIHGISKGLESPAQEVFESLLEALNDFVSIHLSGRRRRKFLKEREKFDEITPKEIATIADTYMDEDAMKEIGWSQEEIDSIRKQAHENEEEGVGVTSASETEEERESRMDSLDEMIDESNNDDWNSDDNNASKLEPNKVPTDKSLIDDDKYYVYDGNNAYLAGPFDDHFDAIESEEYNNLVNKGDKVHATLGSGYKQKLHKSFSYTPKININRSYTIVRSYNLFSKISEFIAERFPHNFSGIDGKKILLNDGRYLKAKIVDEMNFSVTSYIKDQKQFSVILPLKVHKFKWQNSINDNIINK